MWEPGAAEVAGSQLTWATAAAGRNQVCTAAPGSGQGKDEDEDDEDVLEAALVWSQQV